MGTITFLFYLCIALLFHSYVLFPFILSVVSINKKQNQNTYKLGADELPTVAILIAAYNEESVIEEKIKSIFNTEYPVDKIQVYIGADACTDQTIQIIARYTATHAIHLVEFTQRTGKSEIINQLARMAKAEVLILTDANVFFLKQTIFEMVKHYQNNSIALVAGNIVNPIVKSDGISFQEKSYLSRENKIKYQEGICWGSMIGAFGGCYSLRAANYKEVPKYFIVDDFYISMSVLQQGKLAITELAAVCTEDVSNKEMEEFRRKVRIATGNFQNLFHFATLLRNPFNSVAFSFWSHKVIRWIGPFLLALAFITCAFLSINSQFYTKLLLFQLLLMATPIFDWQLKKIGIHFKLLRFASHFYLMNLALLKGFYLFSKGIKTSVWEPTKRNQ